MSASSQVTQLVRAADGVESGPGFDVIGLALSVYLELQVTFFSSSPSAPLNCTITYEGQGASEVELVADRNLLTRTALYVLRCHGQHAFPSGTHVHIINPIPLGRGLGSSGAAVVAGVILGSEVGRLGLTKPRILDYCLMIERHPDNVAAALYGGFVGTYLNELNPEDMARKEIPLSEVLPAPAGGEDTGLNPPEPPLAIGHYIKFQWAPEIKAVAIIPDFEVSTAKAREVLPESYSRKDVVSYFVLPYRTSSTKNLFLDIQHAAPCSLDYRSWTISARSKFNIPSHAGQDAPAVPEDADTRPYRDIAVCDAKLAQRFTRHLSFWRWADHSGSCH